MKKSRAPLDELHPEYSQLIREWNQMDALDPVRGGNAAPIDAALATASTTRYRDATLCLCSFFMTRGRYALHQRGSESRSGETLRVVVLRTAVDSCLSIDILMMPDWSPCVATRLLSLGELAAHDAARWPVVREICADYQVVLGMFTISLAAPGTTDSPAPDGHPNRFLLPRFYTVCPTINCWMKRTLLCRSMHAGAGDCPLPKSWFREPRPWLKTSLCAPTPASHGHRSGTMRRLGHLIGSNRKVITQYFPALDDGRFSIIEHGRDLSGSSWRKRPIRGNRCALSSSERLILISQRVWTSF